MYFCFSITELEFSFEFLVFQRTELIASSSESQDAFLQGALTMLRNGERALGYGYQHPYTLTPPRHLCAFHTRRALSLQVTAMSIFLGRLTLWPMADGSWVRGKCSAALGTTLV